MESEKIRYGFKSDEYSPNDNNPHEPLIPFINMEPANDEDLSILEDGFLSFEFIPGTSYDRVEEIAVFLNKHLAFVQYNVTA
jgi:hypothetical protein